MKDDKGMSEEMKQAFGGPADGADLPVAPERMVAIPTAGVNRYALYEDVGLRYVYKGIEVAEPINDDCDQDEEPKPPSKGTTMRDWFAK